MYLKSTGTPRTQDVKYGTYFHTTVVRSYLNVPGVASFQSVLNKPSNGLGLGWLELVSGPCKKLENLGTVAVVCRHLVQLGDHTVHHVRGAITQDRRQADVCVIIPSQPVLGASGTLTIGSTPVSIVVYINQCQAQTTLTIFAFRLRKRQHVNILHVSCWSTGKTQSIGNRVPAVPGTTRPHALPLPSQLPGWLWY